MDDASGLQEELKKIESAIQAQEALVGILPQEQLDAILVPLNQSRLVLLLKIEGGSAAIGDGAKSVGEDGMSVDGDTGGDIVGPHGILIKTSDDGTPKAGALRVAYLKRVIEKASYLSLSGVDPKVASEAETHLSLSAVYTALFTYTAQVNMPSGESFRDYDEVVRNLKRLSVVEQLNQYKHLVLLGDPGSGKSTFVNFLALCLAGELLGIDEANLSVFTAPLPEEEDKRREKDEVLPNQPWDHGALIPVIITLRDFAARGLPEKGAQASAVHLWAFIETELQNASLSDYAPLLRKALIEKGGYLLLDGLDEVPQAGQRRTQLKQAIEDFCATFSKCRILVTSRTYAYQKQDWKLRGFEDVELAPFTPAQIRTFISRWYEHIAVLRRMNTEDARGRAAQLEKAVMGSDRLMGLAERPLLLTLMASLHAWRGGSLPEKREQLYADTVDLLLDWWEAPKSVRDAHGEFLVPQPSLVEWLKMDRDEMRSLLNELAFDAHQDQPDLVGTADIPEERIIAGLLRLSQNPEASANPRMLVEYLSQRAGLLIPRGVGVYAFPHRTFQEYLAACHLTDHGYPEQIADLARSDPNRWREVSLLAGAKAARGGAFALWPLVECLCPAQPDGGAPDENEIWGIHLAGELLVESADLKQVSPANREKLDKVRQGLVSIIRQNSLASVERAAAGDNLAHLGDPRFNGQHWFLPDEHRLGFRNIPTGIFSMGSNPEVDTDSFDREHPLHRLELPAFYLARYPVTVAQFAAFHEDQGSKPSDPDSLRGLSNHPVVRVTWYEAIDYCRWLGKKLHNLAQEVVRGGEQDAFWQGLADGSLKVCLPSEAEWEKAARGEDGRIYPWGDEFSPDRANTRETGINRTSAVGCFPAGESLYGILDMSGNVFEWTRSLWGEDYSEPDNKYPYKPDDGREELDASRKTLRVVRGGSFGYLHRDARCAFRHWDFPDYGGSLLGFRVVVSPFVSGL